MQAEKDKIRHRIKKSRAALQDGQIRVLSERIADRVLKLPEFRHAKRVALYIATRHEVQTRSILQHCRQSGRRLCAPAYDTELEAYRLAIIGIDTDFIPGPMRVPEPHPIEPVELADCDLILVPGLAFDLQGTRLGHGGGHYDRLLANAEAKRPLRVGLAFERQIVSALPRNETDVPMHRVVTEDRVIQPE